MTDALRGDRLKALREQHGLSQRELSRRLGFGVNQVSKYEKGEVDPLASHLKIIAQYFDVTTDYLLGLTHDPKSPISSSELGEDEHTIVQAFRRGSWREVAQIVVSRWPRSNE